MAGEARAVKWLLLLATCAAVPGCEPEPIGRAEGRGAPVEAFEPIASPGRRLRWLGVLGDRRLRATQGMFAVDHRGRRLVTLTEDHRSLAVWDLPGWNRVHTLAGHREFVSALAVSPDADVAASGSWDGAILLWDLVEGRLVRELAGHEVRIESLAFAAEGRLYSLDRLGRVFLWDTRDGSILRRDMEERSVSTGLAVAPGGAWYALGVRDLGLHTAADDSEPAPFIQVTPGPRLRGHGAEITCLAASPDGNRLVSCSEDGRAIVWDLADGEPALVLSGHEAAVASVAFDPSGARIATGSDDGTIRIRDAASGETLRILRLREAPESLAWTPDGRRLFTGSMIEETRIWDPEAGVESDPRTGHRMPCSTSAGERLVSWSWDRTVRVWDPSDGRELLVLGPWAADVVWAGCLSGGRLLVVTEESELWTFEAATGRELSRRGAGTTCLHAAAPTPDGAHLVTTGYDGEIGIVAIGTGEYRRIARGSRGCFQASVALAPSGLAIAYSEGDGVTLAGLETGEVRLRIAGHRGGVGPIRFTPDGTRIVTASGFSVHGTTGPDGGGTEVRLFDPALRLWDARDGSLLRTIGAHADGVLDLAVAPDGLLVASVSADDVLHVFDLANGSELDRIHVASRPHSLEWAGDDLWIGTGEGSIFRFRWAPSTP